MAKQSKRASADPYRLAVEAATQHFDDMSRTSDVFIPGGYMGDDPLYGAFDAVEAAVEAKYAKQKGSPIAGDDELGRRLCSREAGYLIGLQVGLRLRNVTGGR